MTHSEQATGKPGRGARIWVDLDNSPHVLLFAPVIRELQAGGNEIVVTLRDFSQTRSLAEQHGLQFTMIGRHCQSPSRMRKIASTLSRAWALRRFIAGSHVDAAVSHGSRASLLAAKSLGVPTLTLDDYEFSSIGLYRRFSDRVLVPAVIPESRLAAQGLVGEKLIRYPGIKEEVYVYDFKPDAAVLTQLGIDDDRVLITVRPPATWAHYHEELGEQLFRALLRRLDREEGVQVVMSARTKAQELELRDRYNLSPKKYLITSQAVDGLSLMWYSDMVFSGGGTMVREAALLGVATYSIFGGRIGAADEYLVSQGRLRILRDTSEIEQLAIPAARTPRPTLSTSPTLAPFIAREILNFAVGHSKWRRSAALNCAATNGR